MRLSQAGEADGTSLTVQTTVRHTPLSAVLRRQEAQLQHLYPYLVTRFLLSAVLKQSLENTTVVPQQATISRFTNTRHLRASACTQTKGNVQTGSNRGRLAGFAEGLVHTAKRNPRGIS